MNEHNDPGDEQQRCPFSKFTLGTEKVHQCVLPMHHSGPHKSEGLPHFCYLQSECFGRTSCPRRPACDE